MRTSRPEIWLAGCALVALLGVNADATAEQRTMVALLTGSQEVPPVTTDTTGCARIEIDTATNTLSYHIVYSPLASGIRGAHIHGVSDPGVNSTAIHVLPETNPIVGSWSYPEEFEADILAGRTYINIHSNDWPAGEVRGQIVDMVAEIDGNQAGTISNGTGVGLFTMDRAANELAYYILFDGLLDVETMAHIHGFALHTEGTIVQHHLPTGSPKIGSWTFDESAEQPLRDGLGYVLIHSATFPGGEIRGQITPMMVPLDGAQEVPPSGSTAHGRAALALDRATHTMSYALWHQDLAAPATAAHIHGFASEGVNAGVQHGVGTVNPAIGAWTYGAANEANLFGGLTYFNVHSGAHPGGEVRGQLHFPLERAVCPTDIDGDGTTGFNDVVQLLADWGPCTCAADLDENGMVDFNDLVTVLAAWGPC